MNVINATLEEMKSLENYIRGGHHLDFNKRLRENKPLTKEQKEQYINLYNIINKNRMTEDMIVYRGIKTTEKEFIKSLGLNMAFTSTSKDKPFSSDQCCQLIIYLKKGNRALDVSHINKQENEVLIAPGFFEVIKRYKKDVINKIPSIDFKNNMSITYKDKIVPTIFYELSYKDHDFNEDEEKKSETLKFKSKSSKRKSRRVSRKRKSGRVSRKRKSSKQKSKRVSRKRKSSKQKSKRVSRKHKSSKQKSRRVSRKHKT